MDAGTREQGHKKELYELVGLRGGGKLLQLAEERNESLLDHEIKQITRQRAFQNPDPSPTCSPRCCKRFWCRCFVDGDCDTNQIHVQSQTEGFMYGSGSGKQVSLVTLAHMQDKFGGEMPIRKDKAAWRPDGKTSVKVCWNLERRGTVGETILHLCFLNKSKTHNYLAERLLTVYPQMIHDTYMGGKYYGESVLHMAIVNRDSDMVKFLLDRGADLNARACGNFFSPDGTVYWGEYPLAFAACVGDKTCVKLLLHRGADPNLQDFYGNTVMHMMVLHQNREMFDLCYAYGGRLDIKNTEQLTPLTLAASLAYKDMYDHVLKKEVQLFWIYSNVAATGYPLEHIDTISPDKGHTNSKSALNLIVYGEEEGHVTMMDSLIVKLLEDKWTNFARGRFYRRFFLFFVYCAMFVTAMVLRPGVDLCAVQQDTSSLRGCSQTGPTHNRTTDHCYLMRFYRDEDIARLTFEVCVLAGALMYVFLAVVEILYQGLSKFFTKLRNAPSMALLLLGCVLVFVMFIARLTCEHDKVIHEFEDVVGVLAILCTVPYFLFFCRGIRQVGPFVVMTYKMITGDLLRFFVIYAIFVVGFSQAFFIPFRKTDNSVFNNWLDSIMGMFSMSVGQHDLSESFEDLSPPFLQISKLLFVVYMVMVTLLLINMLIAMMGNTYTIVNTTENVWFRQWARIVLMIEESISPGSRLGMRRQYSQPGQNAQYASKNAKRPGDYHADKASKNAQRTSTAGHDADNADDDEKRIYVVRRHLETTREKEELMRLRIENRRPQLTTCV